jgi:large subunit ribosomal protein L13
MGHERYTPVASMLAKHPERVIEKAVYGMLPKTALGRQELRRKLRVFAGPQHDHVAQQPIPLPTNKLSKIATPQPELANAR